MTSIGDKSFSYKNVFLSSGYHLIKDKKSRSDAVQIIPSLPKKENKKKGLVAFFKMSKRQLHPNSISKKELLSSEELADKYLRRHCPSVDFGRVTERNTGVFLNNKV